VAQQLQLPFDPAGRCYLAAPFFNEAQVDLVAHIEEAFFEEQCEFFSPRLHAGVIQPGDPDKVLDSVFEANMAGMREATWMLAVQPYLLPEGHSLHLCSQYTPVSRVEQPDTGTVWEMGAAFTLKLPTVAFVYPPGVEGVTVNLMLLRSVYGTVSTIDNLRHLLNGSSTALGAWHPEESQ